MGEPLSGQGLLHGGSSWGTDCLGLPVDPIDPMPWCSYMKTPTMCHSLRRGHLGILPQRGAEMTACRRISQLEVHQLLISGLQVAYPIGLNGCEEPIITSLPESLANGISLTRGKSIYLEIDILQSLTEEPDQKAPPVGKCSTIIIASPHKTNPQN